MSKITELFSDFNNQITVSVKDKSDVVIGQNFLLDITLQSNNTLPESIKINFDIQYGLTLNSISTPSLSPDKKNATAIVDLTVNNNLSPDKIASYTVSATGIGSLNVSYTAKKINEPTIKFQANKLYLTTPMEDNTPGDGNDNYIIYRAILNDYRGQPIANTPVTILSKIDKEIDKKFTVTKDDDNDLGIIKSEFYHNLIFITAYSDSKGEVSFRVYPNKGTAAVLELELSIMGVSENNKALTVYIILPRPTDSYEWLPAPDIADLHGNKLIASGSRQTFNVIINKYSPMSDTDSVIFFNQYGVVLPVEVIGDATKPDHSFQLYYDMFPLYQQSQFYYVIAHTSGDSMYSSVVDLTYTGGGDNQPSDEFSRPLDPPVIYSSLARPPLDASDDEYIIQEYDIVNLDTIDDYRNNGGIDLFIKIVGTSDLNSETKPKFGDKVFLVMYVNSSSKIINKSMPVTIKTVVGENTSTNIIPIPHEMLVDIASYSDTGYPGVIYFEYYIDSEGIRTYSKDWQSQISTVSPGGGDN
ncbi:hypothetical protein KKJ25_16865 [Xenorhabdus bovienii]|uniref:hypothetical protein n=1 Tax=Xenorhabdus bovienii TaxID=40576 RepID=UPI00237D317F|nr:hypothetical protein [Xenorhabdus bovienii]MDE1496558.1 hypothetical protein [Xenorhabdus bovienii]MDE9474546.1 hypothetical protein [Xenorhabdus bovienii]